jgi:hypothetical protein
LEDLKLERIAVIYPGTRRYSMAKRVNAVPADQLAKGRFEAIFPE